MTLPPRVPDHTECKPCLRGDGCSTVQAVIAEHEANAAYERVIGALLDADRAFLIANGWPAPR